MDELSRDLDSCKADIKKAREEAAHYIVSSGVIPDDVRDEMDYLEVSLRRLHEDKRSYEEQIAEINKKNKLLQKEL